jgi:hypothetical protein
MTAAACGIGPFCPTGVIGTPGPGEVAKACGVGVPNLMPGDADDDGVPDPLEPTLCAIENSNFNADGTCSGTEWSPPTAEGVRDDVGRLLP